jgi:hypothetical protein
VESINDWTSSVTRRRHDARRYRHHISIIIQSTAQSLCKHTAACTEPMTTVSRKNTNRESGIAGIRNKDGQNLDPRPRTKDEKLEFKLQQPLNSCFPEARNQKLASTGDGSEAVQSGLGRKEQQFVM